MEASETAGYIGGFDIFYNLIWGSKGFDRGFAAGEAIRCDPLIANLNINADENQYAFAA